jgi:hypothetical protein
LYPLCFSGRRRSGPPKLAATAGNTPLQKSAARTSGRNEPCVRWDPWMAIHPRLIRQPTGATTMKTLYKKAGFEVAVLAALAMVTVTALGALMHAALNIQVVA